VPVVDGIALNWARCFPCRHFFIDISCRWQKGVNQESIRIPHGRRTVAAPWAASSVQNGHLMQPFLFFERTVIDNEI